MTRCTFIACWCTSINTPHRPVLKQLVATTTPARTPKTHSELLACAAGLSGIGRCLPSLFAPSSRATVTWALEVVLPMPGLSDEVPQGAPRGRSWRAPSGGLAPKAAVLKMVTRALDTRAMQAVPEAYTGAAAAMAEGLVEILKVDGEEDRYQALGCETELGAGIGGLVCTLTSIHADESYMRYAAAAALLRLFRRFDDVLPMRAYLDLASCVQDPAYECRKRMRGKIMRTVAFLQVRSL